MCDCSADQSAHLLCRLKHTGVSTLHQLEIIVLLTRTTDLGHAVDFLSHREHKLYCCSQDQSAHLLWRFQHGGVFALQQPETTVVLIGTNDAGTLLTFASY